MKKAIWFERKFSQIEDNGLMPGIVERLAGTAIRLEAKLAAVDTAKLEQKPNGKWSVKEEIGHLLDLEPLWLGRVEDLKNNIEVLRAADLTNRKTHEANHNGTAVEDLLEAFRRERAKLVTSLKKLSEEELERSSLHPRLKTPMRLIDLSYFVAEHDDHHLAQISFLAESL